MTPAARHRRKLLHWLTIVSLMLALVLQPTLAAIGELHELGHGLDQTHIATEDHGAVTWCDPRLPMSCWSRLVYATSN